MSVCYYVTCKKCKKCLWIGQEGLSGWTFYRGHPGCMVALGEFLGAHMHRNEIRIMSEHEVTAEDYEEIEWQDPQDH